MPTATEVYAKWYRSYYSSSEASDEENLPPFIVVNRIDRELPEATDVYVLHAGGRSPFHWLGFALPQRPGLTFVVFLRDDKVTPVVRVRIYAGPPPQLDTSWFSADYLDSTPLARIEVADFSSLRTYVLPEVLPKEPAQPDTPQICILM